MLPQVLSPAFIKQKLMETFRWLECQIKETKELSPSNCEGLAEHKWIALHRERLEVVEVELTMLKPSGSIRKSSIPQETKLYKALFLFKYSLLAGANMFQPISNSDAVKPKHNLVSQSVAIRYLEK